jgi:hypothetical protein
MMAELIAERIRKQKVYPGQKKNNGNENMLTLKFVLTEVLNA